MSMTLDEMKLAVCEKLPELIVFRQGEKMSIPYHREGFFWRGVYDANNLFREINWPTEGLQVCHEAEKMLDANSREWQKYVDILNPLSKHYMKTMCATYEQRLEALCRVWFPERWS